MTALDHRYWRLWAAAALSNLGDGVRAAAFPLLAVALTRNPVLVASAGCGDSRCSGR